MSSIPKNHVKLNQDYMAVQKYLENAKENKTLRVGVDKNNQSIMYAKTRSFRGRLLAKLNPDAEQTKRHQVRTFIFQNAVNSGVNHDQLMTNLYSDFSKVKHAKSALKPVVNMKSGKYVVGDQIKKSSGASISTAYDENGDAYAFKIFDREMLPEEAFANARNEVELWKKAQGDDHPNILPCLDSTELDGKLYVKMPLMTRGDGVDVIGNLWNDPNVSANDKELVVRTLTCDMLKGLRHAHMNGVIHEDVKFDNLMINMNGEGQLIDWGVAKKKGGNRGETGKDDLTFKSPDLARHDNAIKLGTSGWNRTYVATPADDVWSVGASFVTYLTGRDAVPLNSKFSFEREKELIQFNTAEKTYTRQRAATRGDQLAPFQSFLDKALDSSPRNRASIDKLLEDPVFKDEEVGSPRIRKIILAHCKNAPAPDAVGVQPQHQLANVSNRV